MLMALIKVDALGMATTEERTGALAKHSKLILVCTIFIYQYAQKAEPLEARKNALLEELKKDDVKVQKIIRLSERTKVLPACVE
jgi:purine nucleoside phosphorylase